MKLSPSLVVFVALFWAACSKPAPSAPAAPPPPEPKRNLSESLGFSSGEDLAAPERPAHGAAPAPAAGEPIARTLTGKDGRKLEAILLSRTETAVKIRRKADSVEFTIPFDKLSPADRTFIEQSGIPLTPGR